MKLWHLLVGLTLLLGGGCSTIYYVFPEITLEPGRNVLRGQSKLEKKETTVDGKRVVYLEGGKGTPLVLLHAAASNKDAWPVFAKTLVGNARVIAPDLPGFGESARDADADYTYAAQAARLGAILTALGVEKAHLVGHSYGGGVATVFAAEQPERVLTLTLLAPAGVKTPTEPELAALFRADPRVMEVNNVADLDRVMKLIFAKPPQLPGVIKRAIVKEALVNFEFNDKLGKKLVSAQHIDSVRPYVNRVQAKALLLWGDADRMNHVSGAAVWEELLPNAQRVLYEGCGHAVAADRARQASKAVFEFIQAAGRDAS